MLHAANEMADIPAGKEKTDTLLVPIGVAAENDGNVTSWMEFSNYFC
jgi:hypothetical protein